MNLKQFKKDFDPLIFEFINKKIADFATDNDLNFLKEDFIYLKEFIKDGKRVRPYMAFLSYSEFGGKNKENTLETLIFLEIFHYFCLIHDDIMDNSSKRHGLQTFNNKFGNTTAILIGDFLFSWSWEIILNSNLSSNVSAKLFKLFQDMINEVFLGQALDLDLSTNKIISDELILKKTLLKTAGYTFTKPMLIGLLLSGAYNNKNILFCNDLGKNLGLGFQIQDDLLDITSDFDGKKDPLSDISEGKHTIFTNYVLEHGTKNQKEILKKYFGNKIVNKEEIRNIFIESGAIEFGEIMINNYFKEAKKIANGKKYFLEFINLVEQRKS